MNFRQYLAKHLSASWADTFYQHLFELRPDARGLFLGNPSAQSHKLAATLAVLAAEEGESPLLDAEMDDLGRRHIAYGVTSSLYSAGLQALTIALREAEPNAWRAEWERDIEQLYAAVISRMHVHAPIPD